MASEVGDVVCWYLVTLGIGVAGLIPVTHLFGRLDSRGVLFARPFGLLVVGYVAWLVGWGAPIGYGTPAAFLGLAVLVGWTLALDWRCHALVALIRGQWRLLLLGEVLGLVIFAVVLYARWLTPAAVFTEKPMDMMILVAIHEAERLPPQDAWYAGRALSYYHLGHTMVDVTSRLARVQPDVAFNLGLASAGSMTGLAIFGLAGDASALTATRRRRTWLAGGAATIALLAVGSLEGGLELLAANGLGSASWAGLDVTGFPSGDGAVNGIPTGFWWWWRATRILPDAISEFPAFSFVLGDLHAHVLALPIALLAVGIAITAFEGSRPQTLQVWIQRPGELICAALIFAGLAMTNAWDAPLYGVVWLAAGFAAYVAAGWSMFGALIGIVRHLVPPAALAGLIALPMLSTLEGTPVGISPVLTSGSDPVRLLLFWGPLAALLLACALVVRPGIHRGVAGITLVDCAAFLGAWVLAVLASGNSDALALRGAGWLTLPALAVATAFAFGSSARAYRDANHARAAWVGLAGLATLVVLGTELFHLVDASVGRFNTVFKFWYGGWVLLSIAGGIAVADAAATFNVRGATWIGRGAVLGAAALIELCVLYTPAALLSRGHEGAAPGIDALAYLQQENRAIYASIDWGRTALPRSAVVLEAEGKSFTPTNRFSMATGLPTVVGWPDHEVTWRGSGENVTQRMVDVRTFYTAGASAPALEVARRYGVTHVFIAARELELYGADVAARFSDWHTVFDEGNVRIVEVPVEVARP